MEGGSKLYEMLNGLLHDKKAVKEWLGTYIHGKPSDTIELLNRKLIGHYRYYGVSGNYEGLLKFYRFIVEAFYSQPCIMASLLKSHTVVFPQLTLPAIARCESPISLIRMISKIFTVSQHLIFFPPYNCLRFNNYTAGLYF